MVGQDLAAALNLPMDTSDEEVSEVIAALLVSATHDANPKVSLSEIFHLISKSGSSSLLDPLNTLPVLLPSPDPAAQDIISLIGECGSAKEVVIAVQEAVERLETALNGLDDEDEHESDGEDQQQTRLSSQSQLARLIDLYSSSLPRLKLRRKSASETMHPLLGELEATLRLAGGRASRDEGRLMIGSASNLVEKVLVWVKEVAGDKGDENSLKSLLDEAITACAHCIHSSVAQRTFEMYFPRLTIRSSVQSGWEEGEKVILEAINAYKSLGLSTKDLMSTPSTSSLVVLTYSQVESIDPSALLSSMAPVLIASIQTNTVLDESLAFLLKTLHRHQPSSVLSPDIVTPLSTVLPALASAHPDPPIRHQAFRILSLLLSLSPSQFRLHLLTDLTAKSEFPQMRVASVGLVKEAVLEALSGTTALGSTSSNVFSSPMFLRVFGPILFRPSPLDLFSKDVSLRDFQESQEPPRLVECLALYYIILQRDTRNLTGIRDKDMLLSVERSLLAPLRSTLEKWMGDPEVSMSHMHAIMPLVSLKMSLERVDAARAAL